MVYDPETKISVNGIEITQAQIDAEVQYHQANSLEEARAEAIKTLVIKELLIQRAKILNITFDTKDNLELLIEKLLEKEISIPDVDEETCLSYYKENKKSFVTTFIYEASHILFLAPEGDLDLRKTAELKAVDVLKILIAEPESFKELAEKYSDCPSAKNGGHLGQVSKGQTMPDFEVAILGMEEGSVSDKLVETSVGFHIIKLHKKINPEELPFEAVRGWITKHLNDAKWMTAVQEYINKLTEQAKIEGYELPAVKVPLV